MMVKGKKDTSNSGMGKGTLKYTVVRYIFENGKLPSYMNKNSRLQYHLNKLKLDGIIRKIGKGVWTADIDKFEEVRKRKILQKQRGSTKHIRGHGFQWKIDLPNIPGWYKRKEYLDHKEILYQECKQTKGYKLMVRNYKVWLYPKSIVVFPPKDKSFYHYTAEEAYQGALIDFLETIKGIESRLGISLKIKSGYRIKPSKQHYANIYNAIAKKYKNDKNTLSVKAEDGEWLLIDFSQGVPELETVNANTSKNDMDYVVMSIFNDARDHYQKTGESLTLSALMGAMHGISKNQAVFDANMKSHIEVIRKLGNGVDELRKEIKKIRE